MPVYAKPLTLNKGVDNKIQFQFLNQEQKPVDITGKSKLEVSKIIEDYIKQPKTKYVEPNFPSVEVDTSTLPSDEEIEKKLRGNYGK